MAEGQGAAGMDVEKGEGQKNKDEKKFPNYLIAMQMTNPQVCPLIFLGVQLNSKLSLVKSLLNCSL